MNRGEKFKKISWTSCAFKSSAEHSMRMGTRLKYPREMNLSKRPNTKIGVLTFWEL